MESQSGQLRLTSLNCSSLKKVYKVVEMTESGLTVRLPAAQVPNGLVPDIIDRILPIESDNAKCYATSAKSHVRCKSGLPFAFDPAF